MTTLRRNVDVAADLDISMGPWRYAAACRGVDQEIFFPSREGGEACSKAQMAKAICRSCKVWAEYFRWSIVLDDEHGIFAAMSVKDRREVRRAMSVGSDRAQALYGGDRKARRRAKADADQDDEAA